MACSDTIGTFKLTGSVSTTAEVFFPLGSLLAFIGLEDLDYSIVVEAITGDVEVAAAIQTVRVRPGNPETPTTLSSPSWEDATGSYHARESFTDTEYFFIQPGIMAKVGSGGTAGIFQVSVTLSKKQCGRIIGQKRLEMYPKSNTSWEMIIPVSDWVPTVGIDAFRGILVATDCNSIEAGWVCRTAKDPEAPNSWYLIGSFDPMDNGNNEANTGSGGTDDTLPAGAAITTNPLIQLGFVTRQKSGQTDPHGMFRVAAGFLYS